MHARGSIRSLSELKRLRGPCTSERRRSEMVRRVCSGGACAALKQLLTTIVEGERHWSSEAPGCHWSRPCGAATPISASAHMLQVLPSRKLTLPAVAVHRATHLCLSVHARSKHLAALIEEGLSEATAVSLQWFFKGRQRNGGPPPARLTQFCTWRLWYHTCPRASPRRRYHFYTPPPYAEPNARQLGPHPLFHDSPAAALALAT